MGMDDDSHGGKSGKEEGVKLSNDEENSVGNNNDTSTLGEVSSPSKKEDGSISDNFRGIGSRDESGLDSSHSGASTMINGGTGPLHRNPQPGEVAVRFTFANHDGIVEKIVVSLSCTILSIKETLHSSWPEGRYIYTYISLCPLERSTLISSKT